MNEAQILLEIDADLRKAKYVRYLEGKPTPRCSSRCPEATCSLFPA
ncbi:MAG: hypothetical protein HYV63_09030 [Candidatus Schekmanbacteria bacterium]|nr:hypothetical protein [Candidatus Schekmanbacteria bacterium]